MAFNDTTPIRNLSDSICDLNKIYYLHIERIDFIWITDRVSRTMKQYCIIDAMVRLYLIII